MKRRGFTLTELLATLVVLGIIALITAPVVIKTINNFRSDSVEKQYDLIEMGADDFMADNGNQYSLNENESIYITLGMLKQDGYIDKNLKNTETNKYFANDMIIKITKNKKGYKSQLDTSSGTDTYNSDLEGTSYYITPSKGWYQEFDQGVVTTNDDFLAPTMTGSSGSIITYSSGEYQIKKGDTVLVDWTGHNSDYTPYSLPQSPGIYTFYYRTIENNYLNIVAVNVKRK